MISLRIITNSVKRMRRVDIVGKVLTIEREKYPRDRIGKENRSVSQFFQEPLQFLKTGTFKEQVKGEHARA